MATKQQIEEINERLDKHDDTIYGNGKRGVLERIGRLELMVMTVGATIVGLQVPILIMLVKMVLK